MNEPVTFLENLLKACFVPELSQDLGSVLIQSQDFKKYHDGLELQLPVLYDFVQKHEDFEFTADQIVKRKLKACLVTLLSEITAPNTVYLLNNTILVENAKRLLQNHLQILEADALNIIFAYFKRKLDRSKWKRQLGAIHCFMNFIELYFKKNEQNKMSAEWLTFSLSVSLSVRDVHEIQYKKMGIKIFHVILDCGRYNDIDNLNIYSVIYNDAYNDIYIMQDVPSTSDVWNCLLKCMNYFTVMNSYSWSAVDDMMKALFSNTSLASDSHVAAYTLSLVTKLSAYFTISKPEIESICAQDLTNPQVLQEAISICNDNNCYTLYRWAKSILSLCVAESYRLLQGVDACRVFLNELLKCYLVGILPIPLERLEPHILPFFNQFAPELMKVVVTHNDDRVIRLVKSFLVTIETQLRQSEYTVENEMYQNLLMAIQNLLKHEKFVRVL